MHEPTDPILDETGAETHPAYGQMQVVRVSHSHGAVLFDSDITHRETIRLTLFTATRNRDLHHDWIHGGSKPIVEVEMSLAQWAALVSSMNTSGVPVTIRATESNWDIPGLKYAPRLKHSMDEVKDAAKRTFGKIKAAFITYDEALTAKAPAKARNEALRSLRASVMNTEGNLTFAAESLTRHTENVVQKARADIEAVVLNKATALGLTAGEARGLVELPSLDGGGEVIEGDIETP